MNESKNSAVKNRKLMNQSTIVILLGVIIMASLTVYIVNKSPSMKDSIEAERPVERETIIHLSALESKSNREYSAVTRAVKPGVKIAFNLSTNVPVHVALLSATFEQTPQVLFIDAKIPPGKDMRLEKAGNRFIYQTVAGQGGIKFCLVQAASSTVLVTKLQRLENIWLHLPENQCVQVTVE